MENIEKGRKKIIYVAITSIVVITVIVGILALKGIQKEKSEPISEVSSMQKNNISNNRDNIIHNLDDNSKNMDLINDMEQK